MERIKELWMNYRSQLIGGAIVVLLFLFFVSRSVTSREASTDQKFTTPASTSSISTSSLHTGRVCVDVKGAVKRPGVYRLAGGARVDEALRAAGGPLPTADMRQVNLAKELADQQAIYVPTQGEKVPAELAAESSTAASGSNDNKPIVNLNSASKEQLCQISGIGDKKADLILEYRQQHGQFKSVDELNQVSGFGEKTVAKIKDQLSV
ncbi:helix-hairpin-helix domain-containing protein [Limosilactobacillus panis]|uniref:helix-hairpin-helix domain-containing protein n=1 Tax=Limosilactobacillus panis TaxID=47493 RepID=UPI001C94108F|nr:helix-hairpin-helix domain-containing protein [Limosilactobacillus panis]QZN93747.1 helix-hairpin-helix domain-containing protein [Limosilactobacillus panis]